MKSIYSKIFLFLVVFVTVFSCNAKKEKILVFSKTNGFRHASIETGIIALKKLGIENNMEIIATEDSTYFIEDSLKQYSAIVFLNTTGTILNPVQKADFERYIQAGGGFVGIHSATDTEHKWPWYNKLVGAYFKNHPKIQEAKLSIGNNSHASTKHFGRSWIVTDEWYNFKNINPKIKTLIEIDESSYDGGTNGKYHPMSWYHEYDGGRSFYTGLGHTKEMYKDSTYLKHLLGGIKYAIGNNTLDYSKVKTSRLP